MSPFGGTLFLFQVGYLSGATPLRTFRAVVFRFSILTLLWLGLATSAAAQDAPDAPEDQATADEVACPRGNLLAGKTPAERPSVRNAARLTDGVQSAEGDLWDTERTSIFSSPAAYAQWDLGAVTKITAVDLQGDNNDDYIVEVSDDGVTFTQAWVADPVSGQGMRRRSTKSLDTQGRFLRVRGQGGDGFFSLSEVQAFCAVPAKWPPPVEIKGAMSWWMKQLKKKRDNRYRLVLATLGLLLFIALFAIPKNERVLWVVVGLSLVMLGLAVFRFNEARHAPWFREWGRYVVGLAVVAWAARGILLAKQREAARAWWERGALVWVIVACAAAWVNFGVYHTSRIVHYWDTFHYYIGSKYYEENEYERLYECVLAADYERYGEGDLGRRKIRDLVDNRLHYVSEDDAIRYQQRCAEHFSPERWEAFKYDAQAFRQVMGSTWWKDMLMDHGYNASPISNMIASFLTNIGWEDQLPEVSTARIPNEEMSTHRKRIMRYVMIDLALYAGAFLMIFWAFGLRATALAVLIWGCGYPWAYFWTGGSFARVPWFFMAVASVTLLKRGYPLLSGFTLSWSALLRLFPAAMAGGPIAAVIDRFIRRKKIDRPWLNRTDVRFIIGGVLGLVVLIGSSMAVNGYDAHPRFLTNTLKHSETPLTNHMGLPTVLSYKPSTVGRYTKNDSLEDPWERWKQKRKDTKHDRRWLLVLSLLGMFVLLALLGRQLSEWAVLASSVILIVGFFELTCYYYTFVVLMAPLAIERLRYTVALILMVIVGLLLQFLIGWYDEQYTAETVAVLVPLLYILIDIVLKPLPESSPARIPVATS